MNEEKSLEEMSFLERWQTKKKLNKAKSLLDKLIKQDTAEENEQRKKLLAILKEAISSGGVNIIETDCECNNKDCEAKGRGHGKSERPTTEEELNNKPIDELQGLVTGLFDYEEINKQLKARK